MSWKRICAAAEVPENGLRRFEVDGVPVLIANLGGEFFAYPPLCPHMAEPLETSGVCDDGILTCTKHLWQWDMRTGSEMGMAERPMLLYPTRREGEEIYAEIERELTYEYD